MCGIVGTAAFASAGIFQEDVNVFTDMLIADSVRGNDGTGLMAINAKGHRVIFKEEGNPYNIISYKSYDQITSPSTTPYLKVLAGHNRYATTGIIKKENSHPFAQGHITLMHNGTLRNYDKFPKKFEVDSESLAHAVSEWGLAKAVASMAGAYVVVYYDRREKTLNFARNDERPLFLGIDEKKQKIIWASEVELLDWVLARRKIASDYKVSLLPPDKLFSFSVPTYDLKITELPRTGANLWSPYTETYENNFDYEDGGTSYQVKGGPKVEVVSPPAVSLPAILSKKPIYLPRPSETHKPSPVYKLQTIEKGKNKDYKIGDNITFVPKEMEVLNDAEEKYRILGDRADMDSSVSFKMHVKGDTKVSLLMDEPFVGGRIINMSRSKEKTIVWVREEDLPVNQPAEKVIH